MPGSPWPHEVSRYRSEPIRIPPGPLGDRTYDDASDGFTMA
jgi:hypothetical protein